MVIYTPQKPFSKTPIFSPATGMKDVASGSFHWEIPSTRGFGVGFGVPTHLLTSSLWSTRVTQVGVFRTIFSQNTHTHMHIHAIII